MRRTACAHCGVPIDLPLQHRYYWRCGSCRKVNGRPPYARGVLNGCLKCGWCSFYGSRITHGFATSLLVAIILSGLFWALPIASRDYGALHKCFVWAVSLGLSFAAVGTFERAAHTTPGAVPKKGREGWSAALRALVPAAERAFVAPDRLPWCSTCDNLKPPRTHHCSTCSTCVNRMDHHCAFLHNCVGAGNIGTFVGFLLSVWAGTMYVFLYIAFELFATYRWRGGGDMAPGVMSRALRQSAGQRARPGSWAMTVASLRYCAGSQDGRYAALGCLSFGVWLGVGILLCVYVGLAKSGETSLEHSSRTSRRGPDHRTNPGWPAVFRLDNDELTPAVVLAELRAAGHFEPPLADEAADGLRPPRKEFTVPAGAGAGEKDD